MSENNYNENIWFASFSITFLVYTNSFTNTTRPAGY